MESSKSVCESELTSIRESRTQSREFRREEGRRRQKALHVNGTVACQAVKRKEEEKEKDVRNSNGRTSVAQNDLPCRQYKGERAGRVATDYRQICNS